MHRKRKESEAEEPGINGDSSGRIEPILLVWLGLAVLLTLGNHAVRFSQPLVTNGWVSAHFATMAHAYQEHGIFELGGLPIQNHSPLGSEPDAYIHWPPLFPLVLSWVFGAFGESATTARAFATFLLLSNAALLFFLIRECLSRRAGVLSAFTFLCLPIVASKGEMVMHLHLALGLTLLALLGFVKASKRARWRAPWPWLGVAAMGAAVWTSWEPALATVGLFGLALWRQRRFDITLAAVFCLSAGGAAALVVGLYGLQSPGLLEDLWNTVAFRFGLGYSPEQTFQLHTLVNHRSYGTYNQPSWAQIALSFVERTWANGQIAVVAGGWALMAGWLHRRSSRPEAGYALGGLATLWAGWFLLMKNHAYIHQYEMYIGAPFLAACVGSAAASALKYAPKNSRPRSDHSPTLTRQKALRWTLLALLPATLLFPLAFKGMINASAPKEISHPLLAYAQEIRNRTPEGAVVLSPQTNMIPVYYAQRHVVRGITDWKVVSKARGELPRVFPDSPYYLAVDPEHRQSFSDPPAFAKELIRSENLLLFALSAPPRDGGPPAHE